MPHIDLHRVVDLLQKVARSEIAAKTTHDGACWWTVEAGGLVIVIFDDSDKVDYVEEVTDGSGGRRSFDSFMNQYGFDPIDCLSSIDRKALETVMFCDRLDAGRGR
jgi:hypothetical protein